MGDTGLEQSHDSTGKTLFSDEGGAFSGAVGVSPDDLDEVIDGWGYLSLEDRGRILKIVRRAVSDAGQ